MVNKMDDEELSEAKIKRVIYKYSELKTIFNSIYDKIKTDKQILTEYGVNSLSLKDNKITFETIGHEITVSFSIDQLEDIHHIIGTLRFSKNGIEDKDVQLFAWYFNDHNISTDKENKSLDPIALNNLYFQKRFWILFFKTFLPKIEISL